MPPNRTTAGFKGFLSAWLLPALFIGSHLNALNVFFSSDEPMNIYRVWDPPVWKVGLAHVMFWSDFIRPMGALYYLPLFKFAGFNPVPYNAARLLLLLVNAALFYCLAKILSRSWWIATLAAVPIAYHAGSAYLVYSGSFIYDILCGGFYFAALLYYVRLRRRDIPLGIPRVFVFLGFISVR